MTVKWSKGHFHPSLRADVAKIVGKSEEPIWFSSNMQKSHKWSKYSCTDRQHSFRKHIWYDATCHRWITLFHRSVCLVWDDSQSLHNATRLVVKKVYNRSLCCFVSIGCWMRCRLLTRRWIRHLRFVSCQNPTGFLITVARLLLTTV